MPVPYRSPLGAFYRSPLGVRGRQLKDVIVVISESYVDCGGNIFLNPSGVSALLEREEGGVTIRPFFAQQNYSQGGFDNSADDVLEAIGGSSVRNLYLFGFAHYCRTINPGLTATAENFFQGLLNYQYLEKRYDTGAFGQSFVSYLNEKIDELY